MLIRCLLSGSGPSAIRTTTASTTRVGIRAPAGCASLHLLATSPRPRAREAHAALFDSSCSLASQQQQRFKSKKSGGGGGGGGGKGGKKGGSPSSDADSGRAKGGSSEGSGASTFDAAKIKDGMTKAVERCEENAKMMTVGGARSYMTMLDALKISLPAEEGSSARSVSLKEVANVGMRDGALVISVWDPSMTKAVERAIYSSDLKLVPQALGEPGSLRVPLPRPDAEARENLIRELSKVVENARIAVRGVRTNAQKSIRNDEKKGNTAKSEMEAELSELESLTKQYTGELDKLLLKYKNKIKEGI